MLARHFAIVTLGLTPRLNRNRPVDDYVSLLPGVSQAKERGRCGGLLDGDFKGLVLFRRTLESYRESFSNKGPNHAARLNCLERCTVITN